MIRVTLRNLFSNVTRGESWLVLADETGRRGLAIFFGSTSGQMLALALRKGNPRPLTYNFFANLLETAGVELKEVRIVGLVKNTFHAVACIRSGETEHRIDARPSDAVALAAVMNRPIYVSWHGPPRKAAFPKIGSEASYSPCAGGLSCSDEAQP
jgi:bifunctional DNase/RNase